MGGCKSYLEKYHYINVREIFNLFLHYAQYYCTVIVNNLMLTTLMLVESRTGFPRVNAINVV